MLAAIAVCLVSRRACVQLHPGSFQRRRDLYRFATTFADPVDALHKDRHTFFDDAVFIVTNSPMGIGLGRIGGAAGRLGSGDAGAGFVGFSEAYLGSIMYETGIIGGLLISAITLFFIERSVSALRSLRDPDARLLATAIVTLLVLVFANFFVTPILLGPPGSVLFWLLSGDFALRVFAPKATEREGRMSRNRKLHWSPTASTFAAAWSATLLSLTTAPSAGSHDVHLFASDIRRRSTGQDRLTLHPVRTVQPKPILAVKFLQYLLRGPAGG